MVSSRKWRWSLEGEMLWNDHGRFGWRQNADDWSERFSRGKRERLPMNTSPGFNLGLLEHLGLETNSDGFVGLGLDGMSGIDRCSDGIVLENVRQG